MKKATLAPVSTGVADKINPCSDAAPPCTVFQGTDARSITFIPVSNPPYTHFLPNTYEPVFWAQLCGQMSKLT